jgi:hypothetical protein
VPVSHQQTPPAVNNDAKDATASGSADASKRLSHKERCNSIWSQFRVDHRNDYRGGGIELNEQIKVYKMGKSFAFREVNQK